MDDYPGSLRRYWMEEKHQQLHFFAMDDYLGSLRRYWMEEEEDDAMYYLVDEDEVEAATYDHLVHRMDPDQSNDGSQGAFPGGNIPPYQAAWNPYMYGYQGPPSWFPQGLQQFPPNVSMVQPGTSGPQVFHPSEKADASVQSDEVDMEEQQLSPAPTGKGKIAILQEESVRENDHFQQFACIDEKRFEEMRSYNRSLLECEQEKIRIMCEKHDMDRQKKERQEDERILGIDHDACTPSQRMYYEALQEEIIEKIAARCRKRQGP